jgi:hypothetical protein
MLLFVYIYMFTCFCRHKAEVEAAEAAVKDAEAVEAAKIAEAESHRQEEQRRQIQDALNRQSYNEFRTYAEQQYPDNPDQQAILVRQLQEQHYYQYMQQVYQQQMENQASNAILNQQQSTAVNLVNGLSGLKLEDASQETEDTGDNDDDDIIDEHCAEEDHECTDECGYCQDEDGKKTFLYRVHAGPKDYFVVVPYGQLWIGILSHRPVWTAKVFLSFTVKIHRSRIIVFDYSD